MHDFPFSIHSHAGFSCCLPECCNCLCGIVKTSISGTFSLAWRFDLLFHNCSVMPGTVSIVIYINLDCWSTLTYIILSFSSLCLSLMTIAASQLWLATGSLMMPSCSLGNPRLAGIIYMTEQESIAITFTWAFLPTLISSCSHIW